MEMIDFLQRTEQKNIKSYIGVKVKQKLNEYKMQLMERQETLRSILEYDNIQYNEELVLLLNEKLKDQFRKRLEWINTNRLEQEKAENELLKLKNQQRELENCEEWRHLQSRQLLLSTKEAQLHQIEQKKVRRQKETHLEKMWLEAMDRLNQEKEYQEIYEIKLRKVVAGVNQVRNQEIYDKNKKAQNITDEQLKREFEQDNNRAIDLDHKYRRAENLKKVFNKTKYGELLKCQISSNLEKKRFDQQMSLKEDILHKDCNDRQMLLDLDQNERQRVRNNEWHKCYLENSIKQKEEQQKENDKFEQMYLNTGCVLQQSPKKPYCRNVR